MPSPAAMEPNALCGRELFLARREGIRERQEASRLAFLGHDLAEEGQVIAKEKDGAGILHARALPQRLREAFGRHRRDVFVGEAQVGPHEARVARRDGGHARARGRRIRDDVAREDLLDERHPAGRRRDGRGRLAARETRPRVGEQPARLDHAPRDRILPLREERERNLPAFPHPLEDREIGRQEHSEIDRVLAIDALEALGHEEADARGALRVRSLLAGRALPAPPPGHRDRETPAPYRVLPDRLRAPSPSRHVRPRYANLPSAASWWKHVQPGVISSVETSSRSFCAGSFASHARSSPASWRARRPASSVRKSVRPGKKTTSGF